MLKTICCILAVLCILYGIIIATAGSGTGFFVIWFLIATFFFFLPKILTHKIPWILKALAALAVTVFIVIEGVILRGFSYKGRNGLPYIVVLGAQVYKSGPSRVLKFRLDKAAEYLNENPDTKCIVTGGKGYNEPFTEAEGMATYLYGVGIDPSRVILEKESTNTKENLKNAMKLICQETAGKEGVQAGSFQDNEVTSIGIVSNNFHVYRAVKTANKLGISDACGIAASSTALFLPHNLLREFFSMMKFLLIG